MKAKFTTNILAGALIITSTLFSTACFAEGVRNRDEAGVKSRHEGGIKSRNEGGIKSRNEGGNKDRYQEGVKGRYDGSMEKQPLSI